MGERKTIFLPIASRPLPLTLILSVVLLGCTSESPQTDKTASPANAQSNRAPFVRSAHITPDPVTLSGPVLVQVEGEDPDGDPVTFRFQWLVNGAPIDGQTQSTLSSRMLKRGDLLSVEVTPKDGKTEGRPYRTEIVTVGNTPPEVVRVVLEPRRPQVGDRLRVEADGLDEDGDSIRYRFRWWRNNQVYVEGEENELGTSELARDDTIGVEVIPSDAAGPGKSKFSELLVMANRPPTITSTPPVVIEHGRYEYTVVGVDPEGDPLTYALDIAPPGMTIDKRTGRIEWKLTAHTKGTHRVRVSVHDDRDGYAFQEFQLGLTPSS